LDVGDVILPAPRHTTLQQKICVQYDALSADLGLGGVLPKCIRRPSKCAIARVIACLRRCDAHPFGFQTEAMAHAEDANTR